MKKHCWIGIVSLLGGIGVTGLQAQVVDPLPKAQAQSMNWQGVPLNTVMEVYSELTGRIVLYDPGVPQPTLSLQTPSDPPLTPQDALLAIESLLRMNQIAIIEWGERFIKVVPVAQASVEGNTNVEPPPGQFMQEDKLITQLFEFKYLGINEVQPIIQQMLHPFGKIHPVERVNGVMITDTAAVLSQITKVLSKLDQPIVIRQELKIYQIQFAVATEVADRLTQLIEQSQEDQETGSRSGSSSSRPRTAQEKSTAARIAALRAGAAANGGNDAPGSPTLTPASGELAKKGLVQGKVSIVADERTNILLVTSEPVNFPFFDDIIKVLDIPIEPDAAVKIFPLEFAVAEEVATILNELIGAATDGQDNASANPRNNGNNNNDNTARSVADLIRERREAATASARKSEAGNISQISENTNILADERTNSLLIMGKNEDIILLEDVIRRLDVMLAQVMVEVVILEINLNDNYSFGMDWLQRSLTGVRSETAGPGGGVDIAEPVYGFGGASRVTDGAGAFIDGATVGRNTEFGGGLTYYSTIYGLNLDMVLRAAAGSSDAEVVSSPVILTTDNTEAKITVAESRPIPTSSSTTIGGSVRSNFEYRDIGVVLTVTPRINPNKMVSMEVVQSADNVGGDVVIDNNNVPRILRRELEANLTVSNKTTIVLGGMVSQDERDSVSKIPFLGDIPLVGNFFRSTTKDNSRTEVLVFITPYVLTTPEEAQAETRRVYNAIHHNDKEGLMGWSGSSLLYPQVKPVRSSDDDKVFSYLRSREGEGKELRPVREDIEAPKVPATGPNDPRNKFNREPAVEPPLNDATPVKPVDVERAVEEEEVKAVQLLPSTPIDTPSPLGPVSLKAPAVPLTPPEPLPADGAVPGKVASPPRPSDEAAALKRLEELKKGRPAPAPAPVKPAPAPGPAKPLSQRSDARTIAGLNDGNPVVPLR